ncbi:MAG: arylsulfatase [Gammaproteobacteria bacterium]|nr:arylsulfatase [Gammaproteobacteria bacterium]RPG24952.1 MAG: arylsulfatase [Gammaproteobacteria bacterium TMED50]
MGGTRLMSDERPNIVLIVADDLGFSDLGCYGGEVDTPNLDRLAKQGQRYTQFYTNAKCSPSRAAILTGLYPEQVTEKADGGTLHARNNVTIAEMLKDAGYRTMASGKWHLGESQERRPIARGFERYWGLLSGCSNYFNPGEQRDGEPVPGRKSPDEQRPWCDQDTVMHPFTPEDEDFYTTDAITDHAIEFLEDSASGDAPFFLYLPHCAPHFPLQAWPDDIAKYRERYQVGWAEIRQQRYARLLELGLLDPKWGLPAADERSESSYENLGEHAVEAMAVYAAMVDRLDQSVGRVLDKVRALGKEDNTLVLFMSDNGGCAEEIHNTPDLPPGTLDSYQTVGAAWANASNTPFRLFKDFDHEGGIATPLIASWPAKMSDLNAGTIVDGLAHILDFFPTFAELAGIELPLRCEGRNILPPAGKSFASVLKCEGPTDEAHNQASKETNEPGRELYWMIGGAKAMRQGKWKIVTQGRERVQAGIPIHAGHEAWELYDMETDRCELFNLAARFPDRVAEMSAKWDAWYAQCLEDTRA